MDVQHSSPVASNTNIIILNLEDNGDAKTCIHVVLVEAGSHLDYDEQVAQAYDCQRHEESNEEGVDYEGCVIDILWLRPHDPTHRHLVQATEDHSR